MFGKAYGLELRSREGENFIAGTLATALTSFIVNVSVIPGFIHMNSQKGLLFFLPTCEPMKHYCLAKFFNSGDNIKNDTLDVGQMTAVLGKQIKWKVCECNHFQM